MKTIALSHFKADLRRTPTMTKTPFIRPRRQHSIAAAMATLALLTTLASPCPAQARLKTNAADAEASTALSLALNFDQHPNVAVCHLATAQNLGMPMLNMGMFKAMRMLDSLKASWIRTLELDPGSFTARVQLAKLYLTVPGMMGGSVSKARELEEVREATMQLALPFLKDGKGLAKLG